MVLLLAGCRQSSSTPASKLPVTPLRIGDRTFNIEVADTPEVRMRGLMYRDSMPADHGMLFVFAQATPQKFWMRNTRIPLDILYLDADGRIVSIHPMQPYVEQTTASAAPAKYAIELNQGMAQKSGAKPGDKIEIPEKYRDPRG